MPRGLVVRPVGRAEAVRMCAGHPHAGVLPSSSRYHLVASLSGVDVGLAAWGWGIMPRATPGHLFAQGATSIRDYLELCRFFVVDGCPKNTASQFLAITHRLLRRHAPHVKWLYTYAAGFQGMVGGIYKAAGYEYIGPTLCDSFVWVPNVGLLHRVARWWRYGARHDDLQFLTGVFGPGVRRWYGHNFRYIYWLCDAEEKARLMAAARFAIQPFPSLADLRIWTEDVDGRTAAVDPAFARTVPIVRLRSRRAESADSGTPAQPGGKGRRTSDLGAFAAAGLS